MSHDKIYDVEVVDEIELGAAEDTLDAAGYRLWHKAVRFGTWTPVEIDTSFDREQYEQLDEALQVYLRHFCGAFYNAEENVAKLFCPWIMAASTSWQQAFLSTQLVEEFKHTDFFAIYFDEVFGHPPQEALANPVHDTLAERGQRLLSSLDGADEEDRKMRFVEAVTHYQGIIEGIQANTGYHIFLDVFARKGLMPGLSEGFRNIQRDEGRHVGFGMQMLRHYAHEDERYGRRIREMYEEYLPFIRERYGQTIVVDGKEYGPPPEERGVERLMALYERRMRDIFG
jgi:ribonucleoside-diphosphate reductase beta chain